MGNKFSKLKSIVSILTLIGIFYIGFKSLLFLIFLIPIYIFELKKEEAEEKENFKKFLSQIEGKNFFCYNNKVKGKEFIENEIVPFLNKDIEIIYLDGRTIQSNDYENKYLSKAFNGFKNYSKFPHLMKIKNGEIKDISINNEFYNAINNNGNKTKLSLKMNAFFELEESINNKPQKHL